MTEKRRYKYEPDTVTPSGNTLQEALNALGMTQEDLAQRTGCQQKTISEIIEGHSAITDEIALQFERVLGIPAPFWMKREQRYQQSERPGE